MEPINDPQAHCMRCDRVGVSRVSYIDPVDHKPISLWLCPDCIQEWDQNNKRWIPDQPAQQQPAPTTSPGRADSEAVLKKWVDGGGEIFGEVSLALQQANEQQAQLEVANKIILVCFKILDNIQPRSTNMETLYVKLKYYIQRYLSQPEQKT